MVFNTDNEGKEVKKDHNLSRRVKFSRLGFAGLAWIFTACIVIQVFFAGMAVFENPVYWRRHEIFVHLFEIVPLLMFILAFLGRLPRGMAWGSFGMLILIFAQYMTAHQWASALHPVIALLLFLGAVHVAKRSLQIVSGKFGR